MNFALVSTVDSMGPDFPSHCVILFETEREAVLYAVACILEHDPETKHLEAEGVWTMGDDHWDEPADFLDEWQGGLTPTEYFHVKPVVNALKFD